MTRLRAAGAFRGGEISFSVYGLWESGTACQPGLKPHGLFLQPPINRGFQQLAACPQIVFGVFAALDAPSHCLTACTAVPALPWL